MQFDIKKVIMDFSRCFLSNPDIKWVHKDNIQAKPAKDNKNGTIQNDNMPGNRQYPFLWSLSKSDEVAHQDISGTFGSGRHP